MFLIWKYSTPITIRKPYYMFISGKIKAGFATQHLSKNTNKHKKT